MSGAGSGAIITCGSLRKSPVDACAERAAKAITTFEPRCRRALTVDPEGRVAIEPVTSAAEADLVGVYENRGGWLSIAALIAADLRVVAAAMRPRRAA